MVGKLSIEHLYAVDEIVGQESNNFCINFFAEYRSQPVVTYLSVTRSSLKYLDSLKVSYVIEHVPTAPRLSCDIIR